jgi:ParB-like chromosome segregation protein Spo0J
MNIENMPISNIEWIEVDELNANDYNPNVVFTKEKELLKFSIIKNGWIQPILTTEENIIIDGFHRATLAKTDKEVKELTNGKVPVVRMKLSEPERMLLTIRINRAKGSHIAVKMGDIIKKLINNYGISKKEIMEQIGATKDEIELLMLDNVFKKYEFNEESEYSKAWVPKFD